MIPSIIDRGHFNNLTKNRIAEQRKGIMLSIIQNISKDFYKDWNKKNTHNFVEITLEAKKGSSVMLDCTKEHSTTSGAPLRPFKHASAKMAPA